MYIPIQNLILTFYRRFSFTISIIKSGSTCISHFIYVKLLLVSLLLICKSRYFRLHILILITCDVYISASIFIKLN